MLFIIQIINFIILSELTMKKDFTQSMTYKYSDGYAHPCKLFTVFSFPMIHNRLFI